MGVENRDCAGKMLKRFLKPGPQLGWTGINNAI